MYSEPYHNMAVKTYTLLAAFPALSRSSELNVLSWPLALYLLASMKDAQGFNVPEM